MPAVKKALNPIPPTLRGKKRYVKFKFLCKAGLSEKAVWDSVSGTFSLVFGASGIALQRLWLVKWFPQSNEGILRCALSEEENVKAGLLFVQKAGAENVIPLIVSVSGSVRKLKQSRGTESMAGLLGGGRKWSREEILEGLRDKADRF